MSTDQGGGLDPKMADFSNRPAGKKDTYAIVCVKECYRYYRVMKIMGRKNMEVMEL